MTILVVAAIVAGASSSALAGEEGSGSIQGILYESDTSKRLPAAQVIAVHVTSRKRYESNLTGSNGAFEIKGMQAGTYDIVIESGGRLFMTDSLLDLATGERLTVSYTVEPR